MELLSKLIQFETELGGGAEITRGTATLYRIDEDAVKPLNIEEVTSSVFKIPIQLLGSHYYYLILDVYGYRLDGQDYSVDGRNIRLLTVFDETATIVSIGARSTIANAYCFARFIRIDDAITLQSEYHRLKIAYGMKNNFLKTDGQISPVISSSPNGNETNSYSLFNFLSNTPFYCLTEDSFYTQFLSLANGASSFFEALMNLVNAPFTSVPEIYALIAAKAQLFLPSLPGTILPGDRDPQPNQWTLTIKANDSGAQNFVIGGSAYVVFDKEDKAWIATNTRQGTPNSACHCTVLNADASPASFSPIAGGGILGPGFGVAIDPTKEKIAIGNYGWGSEQYNPQHGSISRFLYNGQVVSGPNGDTNGLSRVQGMCYDNKGNLWMASMGTQSPMAPSPGLYKFPDQESAVVVYIGGNPENMVSYKDFNGRPSPFHSTFDVVMNSEGDALVSNAGGKSPIAGVPPVKSSVHKLRLVGKELICLASWESDYEDKLSGDVGLEQLRQVQVNGNDEIFVGGTTSSRIIRFDKDLKPFPQDYTTNILSPWGITFDSKGTMFVSNFAYEKNRASGNTLDMEGPFSVAVITDQNDFDSAKLMTLPTGGHPVTLANGQPLYGNLSINANGDQLESFEPLMRLTASGIDGAGNLWAMNNWKPSFQIDVQENPGGDGVVIFIGVAEPA